MKIVIDIPQGLKIDFENENWTALTCAEMKNALMQGAPLSKGKWIPVSDPLNELPKDKKLLVTVEEEIFPGKKCRYVTELYYDMTEWVDDINDAKNAIAYQYYPEPYKEEEE